MSAEEAYQASVNDEYTNSPHLWMMSIQGDTSVFAFCPSQPNMHQLLETPQPTNAHTENRMQGHSILRLLARSPRKAQIQKLDLRCVADRPLYNAT